MLLSHVLDRVWCDRRALLMVVLLGGCGGATQIPAPRKLDGCSTARTTEAHEIEVYLSIVREGETRPLCPGEALSPSDALWISIELDTAAHVRMVFVAPDGQAGELTRQDEADLTRLATFRAPEGLLAHANGEAQLVLVASHEPLAQADPAMQLMFDVIRDTGTLVDRDGTVHPPPPDNAPAGDLHIDAERELHADFNDSGVAMIAINVVTRGASR